MSDSYDVIVIGAGPAGYVAAIRCAQLGLSAACIDDWCDTAGNPVPGGTCLNAGCIPSKALLESSELYARMQHGANAHGLHVESMSLDLAAMMARKDHIVRELGSGIVTLFKSNGIDWLHGRGQLLPNRQVRITHADGTQQLVSGQYVILASGSVPVELSAAPVQGERIVDSRGALAWSAVPSRVGVIGAGVIGLELGSVWSRLGSAVTLLEAQESFLAMADRTIAAAALKLYRAQGLDIRTGARVLSTQDEEGAAIQVAYQDAAGDHELAVDRLIVAVGRRPGSESLATAEAGLLLGEGGFVHVDEHCATNLPGVFAVGDLVRGPMLAHKGSAEGVMVAERIAGQHSSVNYDAIPSVIYTHPEIAWVGKTEAALRQSGIEFRSGTFPFAASGRARAMQASDGLVKVLSDARTDRVLGVHILGAQASELIGQAVLAMEFGASSEDIARSVFAHPTLSEALHEAALAGSGHAIHLAVPRQR
jgi:dihydrolipoamide dehydrogenase